ncbi:gamma carbonic anhydrase family protein [Mesoterricola sediminis]|uniref:Gamma carbonic anhydrase family protein n=1 Tax=Mesoterricola sediminis TaxID=2927980 RepID=A0AA48GX65_9BACT|nr:gamma carbonic anhydrase family protein [Mesoterricola sediminis]BDU75707.1 gamma carbonic anhydrase family protein [Mesoterricola sediminis]
MILPFQGMAPRVGRRVLVAPNATVLGDVVLGDDCSVWFNCVLRGDVNAIRIGARVNIQDFSCLHVTNGRWSLTLEDDVSIAHNVMLHGCIVRRGALVGMSTTIMDGAEVGEGCLVAAGSLLREGFKAPAGTLVAGWPAQVKGEVKAAQRELIQTVSARYVKYKEAYFKDGWPMAVAPEAAFPSPGFADGHEAP